MIGDYDISDKIIIHRQVKLCMGSVNQKDTDADWRRFGMFGPIFPELSLFCYYDAFDPNA